jgi:hypothetical protein
MGKSYHLNPLGIFIMPDGIIIDSTLWAALVSAIVAIVILGIDRYWIEPRKWSSRFEIKSLERQLEALQWLLSVLAACKEKAGRIPTRQGQPERGYTHLLESDDVQKLEDIFEKKASLLSRQLKQTWYDLQREDTSFLLDSTKHREPMNTPLKGFGQMKHKVFTANLANMERQAKSDFATVSNTYFKKTGFWIANQ